MKNTKQMMLSEGTKSTGTTGRDIESNADKGKEPLESRPLKLDCAFYVKAGYCKYGDTCRFNHPPREMGDSSLASRLRKVGEGDRRIPCQFYLNPVGCRHGNACKFAHYPERFDAPQTRTSIFSFPIRPEDIELPDSTFLRSCGGHSGIRRLQHPPMPTSQADQCALPEPLLEKSSSSKYKSRALPLGERFKGLQVSNEPVSSSGVSHSQMLLLPHQILRMKGHQNPAVSTSSSSKGYMEPTAPFPTLTKSDDTINQQANTGELPKSLVQLYRPNTCPTESPTGSFIPISFPRRPNLEVSASSSSKSYDGLFARVSAPTKSEGVVSQQVRTGEHLKSQLQFIPTVSTSPNVRDTPTMTKSDVTNNQQASTKQHPKTQVQINLPISSSSSSSKDNIRHTARGPRTTRSSNTINQQANTEEHPERQVQVNHPNAHPIRAPTVAANPAGLPLRPNRPVCTFYRRYGLCISGIGCQHDHPVGYGTAPQQ